MWMEYGLFFSDLAHTLLSDYGKTWFLTEEAAEYNLAEYSSKEKI